MLLLVGVVVRKERSLEPLAKVSVYKVEFLGGNDQGQSGERIYVTL